MRTLASLFFFAGGLVQGMVFGIMYLDGIRGNGKFLLSFEAAAIALFSFPFFLAWIVRLTS